MAQITYTLLPSSHREGPSVEVRLDRRITGYIRKVAGGFRYYPKGAGRLIHGDVFPTVAEVKKSLEDL